MKRTIFLIFLTVTSFCCQIQHGKYVSEISFVYNLKDEKDVIKICEIYDSNRELFLSLKNESGDYGVAKIGNILSQSELLDKSKKEFLSSWIQAAQEHRSLTSVRDSSYVEGVVCLENNLEKWETELDSFIKQNKNAVESILSKDQINQIKEGVDKYRKFNSRKKVEFLREESLQLGKLGDNIIAYNQLSFDVINNIITSQYGFGLPINFSEKVLAYYNDNLALINVFDSYRILEEKIVNEITSKECLKRVGILRYYDGLNDEQKVNAIKVNMLMNFIKE